MISCPGYDIDWFGSQLSEGYLCEKFLRQEWQWDAAVEVIQWQLEPGDQEEWWIERADKLKAFIADPGWEYDEPTAHEFYEFMSSIGADCCELPGNDYPRTQAGWLCAVQQRFSELLIADAAVR